MDRFRLKVAFTSLIFLLIFAVVVSRFFYLQVLKNFEIVEKAEELRTRIKLYPPKRGEIFTRDGALIATNIKSIDIIALPNEIKGDIPPEVSDIVPIKTIHEIRKKRAFHPIPVKTDLEYNEAAEILPLLVNVPFLYTEIIDKRFYPLYEVGSHVVGYIKVEKTYEYRGVYGVEKVYDSFLRGSPSRKIVEINALGEEIKVISEEKGEKGKDIILTIHSELQRYSQEILEGKEGAIVVMDVRSGDILALASSPAFDPNTFSRKIEEEKWHKYIKDRRNPLLNRAISGTYNPGSVFKLLVAIATIEEGVISPKKKVFCGGKMRFGDKIFHCWKKEGHGYVDLKDAIVHSCDIYFYELGLALGVDKISRWAKKFGFGEKTGIDLTAEARGVVPSRKWKEEKLGEKWYEGENLSLAIGQGYLTSTPLQLARFVATLVNGGYLVTPHVVLAVDGRKLIFQKKKIDVKESTLEFIKQAMLDVVEKGTARAHRIRRIKYGGKTGTVQVVSFKTLEKLLGKPKEKIKEEEIPKEMRDHAWFVAFAPYDDPEIAVSVLVEHCGSGSKCAAPLAKKIIEKYFEIKMIEEGKKILGVIE